MRLTALAMTTLLSVALIGCAERTTTTRTGDRVDDRVIDLSGKPTETREHSEVGQPIDRDNTGVNVRDRNDAAKTPINQNENQQDVNLTSQIRQRVVDTNMSVNAHNVKIITQDGRVTLRGPVDSAEEKNRIEQIAQEVAGADKVDNQLEVQATP